MTVQHYNIALAWTDSAPLCFLNSHSPVVQMERSSHDLIILCAWKLIIAVRKTEERIYKGQLRTYAIFMASGPNCNNNALPFKAVRVL